MKRNYEQQMAECKEREYKMQLQMKDLASAANMTMTQFAVNALLSKGLNPTPKTLITKNF
ncbi:BRO-B [Helicoverpa armigera granulovirus]|uniref:BRO-B n=1 Tax=Helicoverpa armigera granulovirus TaxID=489830 RepID=A9YMP7_9BBAC|nr:BRO-B [Helicoverpa armigera granulovirus]ABY47746.1 BRO-B [Helicoverpa armigera granulovirus]